MTTETDRQPAPAEVLIPEARQLQRQRYRRRGTWAIVAALVVAAVALNAVLLTRGPGAGGKAPADPKPAATTVAGSRVYFRPVLCFAAPYASPADRSSTVAPRGTEPIPACAASSLLTAANLNVSTATGLIANQVPLDPAYASYPSTSVDRPGYASNTVLLPGLHGACDGQEVRCVLGPAVMSSRAVGTATVVHNQTGAWVVDYSMAGSANAALWDKVAEGNFHQFLGIELHGVVYTAPIIQPTQSSFSSFDGRGEISASLTHAEAVRLAKALNTHRN